MSAILSGRWAFPSAAWLDLCVQQRCLSCVMNQTRNSSTDSRRGGSKPDQALSVFKDWKDYLNSSVISSITALNLEMPRKLLPNYEKILSGIFSGRKTDTASKNPAQVKINIQTLKGMQELKRKTIPPPNAQTYSFQQAMEEQMKTVSDYSSVSRSAQPVNSREQVVTRKQFGFVEKPDFLKESDKKMKQRKAWVSKTGIDQRTRALVLNLRSATSNASRLKRAEELAEHLTQYPDARSAAVKEKGFACLLKIKAKCSSDKHLMEQIRETLSLMGYVDPVKGRGIRVLSIDGGGTRGIAALETLMELERRSNKEIHELFDYICGVSTGSLIAAMIAVFKLPLEECMEVYKQCSMEMFSQGRVAGTAKLFLNHAFYDASVYETMLKENMHDLKTVQTSRFEGTPKYSAVSCLVNVPVLTNYLFRNYGLPPNVQPHYPGSFKYKLWEAIRASSAAPGYYEEYKLDDNIHQDGGLLTNNPAAIALHECKLLWPNDQVQCVISLGTGRYEGTEEMEDHGYSSLKRKLLKVVQSATDTEAVHTVLGDLLPPNTYYRFNPYMSEDFLLDEIREDKTKQLLQDTKMYLRKNEHKLQMATKQLMLQKRPHQKCKDWLKLKSDMMQ